LFVSYPEVRKLAAMNNIKSVESITHQELQAGIYGGLTKGSWHETYKESAWVFLGE